MNNKKLNNKEIVKCKKLKKLTVVRAMLVVPEGNQPKLCAIKNFREKIENYDEKKTFISEVQ